MDTGQPRTQAKREAIAVFASWPFGVLVGMVGVIGAAFGLLLTDDPGTGTQTVIGWTLLLGVIGIALPFVVVFAAKLVGAPYKQRKEALERAQQAEHALELAQRDPAFAALEAQERRHREEDERKLRQALRQINEDFDDFRKRLRKSRDLGDQWEGPFQQFTLGPTGEVHIPLLAATQDLEDLHWAVQKVYRVLAELRSRAEDKLRLGRVAHPRQPIPGEKDPGALLAEFDERLKEAQGLLEQRLRPRSGGP